MTPKEWDSHAYSLSQDIWAAIETKDRNLIRSIRRCWKEQKINGKWRYESWKSIQEKFFKTSGSTWVVWWQDGVNEYIKILRRKGSLK